MIRHEVSISLETYQSVIKSENLGEPHPTLVDGLMWYPADERHTAQERVREELRSQGLLSRDRVSDEFLDTMITLQRAAVEYYTYAVIDGEQVTVRGAAIGGDAVLATAANGMLKIELIPRDQLGVRVAAALPDTPAARMHSISCDLKVLQAVEKGKDLPPGPAATDAKRMHKWLHLDRLNVGELHAAIRRDAAGRRIATTTPVPCWIDTESGRGLFSVDPRGWASVTGASIMEIAGKFEQLEQAIR